LAGDGRRERAIARFDAANAEDPNEEIVDGHARPKELVYAERMTTMLARFSPEASEVLRLAARCQHIQRWKIPRTDFAPDRIGYLQWRKKLNKFHAQVAAGILREVGYDESSRARGRAAEEESLGGRYRRAGAGDVVALVFLESYLASFVAAHAEYAPAKFAASSRRQREDVAAAARPPDADRAAARRSAGRSRCDGHRVAAIVANVRSRPWPQPGAAPCLHRGIGVRSRGWAFRKNATTWRRGAPSARGLSRAPAAA
jgi:hypothetical protein